MTKLRRQVSRGPSSGHVFFGGAGWLFADLMVALTMMFLVATTVGLPPLPKPKPVAAHHKVVAKKKAQVKKTQPPLSLDFIPIKVTLNPTDILSRDAAASQALRNALNNDKTLMARCRGKAMPGCVGLVLLYGPVPGGDNSYYPLASSIDKAVWAVLQNDLGSESVLFSVAKNRIFYGQDATSTSDFRMDLYVFANS
jgi:hypothetical protein